MPRPMFGRSPRASASRGVFMASLRGERLWRIRLSTGNVDDRFVHGLGRLRDVVSGPDGTLWFMSNNTDGRGDPAAGDDRLDQLKVAL